MGQSPRRTRWGGAPNGVQGHRPARYHPPPHPPKAPTDSSEKRPSPIGPLRGTLRVPMRPGSDPLVTLIEAVLLLAVLVIVPAGLPLTHELDREGRGDPLFAAARRLCRAGGPLLALALYLRGGWASPLCALPWLAFTVTAAAWGARRLTSRSAHRIEELAQDLALLYLPVGGAWAVAYTSGMVVLGFAGTQALLTAVHFHFAGFGACLVAGQIGRRLGPDQRAGGRSAAAVGALYPIATAGIMSGVALVAAGITLSHWFEIVAAWVVALSTLMLGGALVTLAARPGVAPGVARALLALAGSATLVSGALALHFSITGFASLGGGALTRMVRYHGLVNALGFVGCSVLAFRLAPRPPRSARRGVPFSRLSSDGPVGASFFERTGAVSTVSSVGSDSSDAGPRGLMDDLDAYRSPTLDTGAVGPDVRAFYESTRDWTLHVVAAWQPGFSAAGLIWKRLARSMGQLDLPWASRPVAQPMTSRIVPLREDVDGRPGARGWVRTYRGPEGGEGAPIYVAAYGTHEEGGRRYMNIAFPLPWGNLTSVLRLDALGRDGGVRLTTLRPARDRVVAQPARDARGDVRDRRHPGPEEAGVRDGDQGVYLVTALGAVRLPMDETIEVWGVADDVSWRQQIAPPEGLEPGAVRVLAVHALWVLGLPALTLTYFIERGERVASP
jgi:hypothetical protein